MKTGLVHGSIFLFVPGVRDLVLEFTEFRIRGCDF